MNIKRLRTIALIPLLPAASLFANPHVESPDAGVTETTAQIVPRRITEINGFIGPGTEAWNDPSARDVDVYCFTIDKPVTGASITVISPDGGFDPNLLLLREGFYGIWGDDDSGGGIDDLDSRIVTNLAAGTYYIAVGSNNIAAYEAGPADEDDYPWNNDSNELDPGEASAKIAFIGASDSDDGQNASYRIVFNFETADDPATAAMRKSLEKKVKKLKKKQKKAKRSGDFVKAKKFKKKLKRVQKKLKRL